MNLRDPHYFDGDRATPWPVRLVISSDQTALRLERAGEPDINWPVAEVRRVADQAGRDQTVLRWTGDPLARLVIRDRTMLRAFPALDKRAPPKGRGRLAAWALAAIGAVALQVFVLIPLLANQLAEFIPAEGERALGEATLGQIRSAMGDAELGDVGICDNPDGLAALQKMETRLTENLDLEQPLSVHVLNHKMVNAFALPGGYVTFFDGLIQKATSPEQVASVFAHEIGHVVSRDPTRNALRSAGSIGILGLLFGDFAGGAVVLFLSERLINAQYTQTAEAQADEFAIATMIAADLTPASLGDFFDVLRQEFGDRNSESVMEHFQSHPALGDRIEAARAAAPKEQRTRKILTAEEWQALRNICD
jgi:predicted Zn-dependent protease